MNNIIICSFFTDDDYYRTKQAELSDALNKLNIDSDIRPLTIPEGMVWSDICRKKISFLAEMCERYQEKKVFWIDVDCTLEYLPDFIANFSADIIGFSRGFSSPMKVGYHLRSRFWEPCFLGINNTPMGRKFIKDAERLEKVFAESATDDYFFEEAWRANCDELSYQVIPSQLRVGISDDSGFFNFGASGNVDEFKGTVAQHKKINAGFYGLNDLFINGLKKIGLYSITRRIYLSLRRRCREFLERGAPSNLLLSVSKKRYKLLLLAAAINNDLARIAELESGEVSFSSEDKTDLINQARAIIEYRNYAQSNKPLPLCWWFNPEPGNMGDWLSPYIVSRIAERGVQLVSPSKMPQYSSDNLVCVGSIAKFANDHSIVIGAGVSRAATELNAKARYLSVRGPKTGQVLEASGITDPGVYGDPAIVMPRLYSSPKSEVKKHDGRALLVRHFSHLNLTVTLPDTMDELSILASKPSDIEAFIDHLHRYDYVITSAMHCYILCQAYGIAAALVVFDEGEFAVAGDGMKYLDYAEGVGVEALSPTKIPADLAAYDFSAIVRDVKISDEKIDALYDFLKQQLDDKAFA